MDNFSELHKEQLASLSFPPQLVQRLYEKLISENFDSGGETCVGCWT